MIIKKTSGKIFGAKLSRAEEDALKMEIHRQISESNERNSDEIDAVILWILHTEFGFGEKRLRRFHDRFGPEIKALTKRYELPGSDTPWLCTKKLLDDGIDIRAWNRESEENEG